MFCCHQKASPSDVSTTAEQNNKIAPGSHLPLAPSMFRHRLSNLGHSPGCCLLSAITFRELYADSFNNLLLMVGRISRNRRRRPSWWGTLTNVLGMLSRREGTTQQDDATYQISQQNIEGATTVGTKPVSRTLDLLLLNTTRHHSCAITVVLLYITYHPPSVRQRSHELLRLRRRRFRHVQAQNNGGISTSHCH